MLKMYGIPNCDTVKKARKKLDDLGLEYEFFNFKKETPTQDMLVRWEKFWGELPANKRGPTFRKIKEQYESAPPSGQRKLLLENLSAIKRPILEKGKKVVAIGFDEDAYSKL
jgi:arsenate reductase